VPAGERAGVLRAHEKEVKRGEMVGMFLVTTGGGLGLVLFGPISERLGRRGAFLLYHLGGLVSSVALFQAVRGLFALWLFLPAFGFLTLGLHAGYAVYFPELFPTRLRGTGGGFCFNVGRVLAAPILFLSGWMQKARGITPADAASLLSLLFLVGVVLLPFAPETRGRELE
jgi:MFS family permease